MENPIFVNGRKIDSFGDWDTGIITQHPGVSEQRQFYDKLIEREQAIKMLPKEIIYVTPEEPQEMPDLCKSEALLELEKQFYPALKEQRIKLDNAYDKLFQMKDAIEPSEFEIQDELAQKPYVFFEHEYNDGFGIYQENVPAVLNSLPAGHRVVKMIQAPRGTGQLIYTTSKSDEELFEEARQNILASRNKQLDNAKLHLKNELDAMKKLVKGYEDAKKIAIQGDIEQLLRIPQKYAKAI
ncbi:transposase [Escherichia albertii]|uniref:transposase n=1 Tax=Escherichia albertii TaxID=208962 RepID=UPI001F1BEF9D|nr:transposase [Escherichia albertii]MCE7719422.1 transposase [Escherichia albertii]MCE7724131.1 transposase [Escherichia albertii]